MQTQDDGALRAALTLALQNWAGVDDVQIIPREGVPWLAANGVDGGFWVKAQVWVSDDQVQTLLGRKPEDAPGESKRVGGVTQHPDTRVLSQEAQDQLRTREIGDLMRNKEIGETLAGGRRVPSDEEGERQEMFLQMRKVGGAAGRLADFLDSGGDIEVLLRGLPPDEIDPTDLAWEQAVAQDPSVDRRLAGNRPPYDVPMTNAKGLGILADSVNQLAIMVEDAEYARTTGLRSNSTEFAARQKRLRQIREWVAPLIEP